MTERTASLGAKRYLSLCAAHGLGEAALLDALRNFPGCSPNIAVNVGNYLSGVTQDCRSNCKEYLIDFANQRLGEQVGVSFFDLEWHPMMVIDRFASDNRNHTSILTNNNGRFVYIVEKHATSDHPAGLRIRNMSVTPQGADIFKVSIGDDGGDAYTGFAMSASNAIYIIAFDQSRHSDVLMFTLRPVAESKLEPASFAGVQTCTLPRPGARIAYAASRRTLVIRKSAFDKMTAALPEGKPLKLPDPLSEWLGGAGLMDRPGFVIDLDEHEEFEE